jgi:hypothetical protein
MTLTKAFQDRIQTSLAKHFASVGHESTRLVYHRTLAGKLNPTHVRSGYGVATRRSSFDGVRVNGHPRASLAEVAVSRACDSSNPNHAHYMGIVRDAAFEALFVN